MTNYYVQIRKGGAWHIGKSDGVVTRCGLRLWKWILPTWIKSRPYPQQPLCKRCERSKR